MFHRRSENGEGTDAAALSRYIYKDLYREETLGRLFYFSSKNKVRKDRGLFLFLRGADGTAQQQNIEIRFEDQ